MGTGSSSDLVDDLLNDKIEKYSHRISITNEKLNSDITEIIRRRNLLNNIDYPLEYYSKAYPNELNQFNLIYKTNKNNSSNNDDDSGYSTCFQFFCRSVIKYPQSRCAASRNILSTNSIYNWLNYRQIYDLSITLGYGILNLIKDNTNQSLNRIAIFSGNRVEWLITELGCFSQSLTIVPISINSSIEAIYSILSQHQIKIIFVSKYLLPQLFLMITQLSNDRNLSNDYQLEYIIQYHHTIENNSLVKFNNEIPSTTEIKEFGLLNYKLFSFSDILVSCYNSQLEYKIQSKSEINLINPALPNDLAYILYTSGTTSNNIIGSAVPITHCNIISAVSATPHLFNLINNLDIHYSYLPLSHIMEHIQQLGCWLNGIGIGYTSANNNYQSHLNWIEDCKLLHPTYIAGVPRIFLRLYQYIIEKINSKSNREIIINDYYFKKHCLPIKNIEEFNLIKSEFGLDSIRIIVTAAAPCPGYLQEFLRIALDATVFQSYGCTETSGRVTISDSNDFNVLHSGAPGHSVEIQLISIPDMNYYSTDKPNPRGEILIHGPQVFNGYLNDNNKNYFSIINGKKWFHTGDIGRWNPNGTLSIIDRKVNILKLSNGEYVSLEKVESLYSKCQLIQQIWVYGDSMQSILVAIIVPINNNSTEFSIEFFDQLNLFERQSNIKGIERIRNIYIEFNPFTESESLLTSTGKLRRKNLFSKYSLIIEKLFQQTPNGK